MTHGNHETAGETGRQAEALGLRQVERVPDAWLDPSLVAELPVEWARSHALLPVRVDGVVCVLTADPAAVSRQEALALLIGGEPEPVLAAYDEVMRSIERCYYRREDSPDSFLRGLDAAPEAEGVVGGEDLLAGETAPVTRLINLILLEAVKRRASDIHFEPFEDRLRVRYRVDGVLYEQAAPPRHLVAGLVSRLKVMGRMDIAERRMPQDGMARVRVGAREIDVRLSTVPVAEGERVVLRLLDRASTLLPLTDLGMPVGVLASMRRLLRQPHGILVVSGPTGSGKTTTLYAALGCLDAARRNIMTIEEPIEYQIPNIGQIQVNRKIGLTFAHGLRHILRQDPDVVLVGETRDQETADIAVRSSLTGHLVLTTLHTNDAVASVLRLIDMGVEPYLLAASLRGVLAQRLVRRLCPTCRNELPAEGADLSGLGAFGERVRGRTLAHAVGCPDCLEGYSGRVGLFELAVMDEAMREAVRSGAAGSETLRRLARESGMRPLVEDGVDKLRDHVTSLEEVLAVAGA